MDPAQWEHIKELFASALEREPAQRSAFLKEACGDDKALREELESLVAAHQQAGSTVSGADLLPAADQAGSPLEDSFSGRRIGHYQFLRRIGQGGMAAVYLAVRADDHYKKRVPIKLIPAGLDSEELLRRFRNERQTLAALDHPNIVKLLDGGHDRGRLAL